MIANMDSPTAEGRSGLLEWSEPVIFDRLKEAYARRAGDLTRAARLAKLHAKVWRALISGDLDLFQGLRGDLVRALSEQGLDVACLVEADLGTMNELRDIVVSRFRRSRRIADGYGLALSEVAGRLNVAMAA
jgi:hypothetical protein